MDQKDIAKQVIDFQKNTFNNSFNAMVMLQDQSEKMLTAFLGQASWVPQEFNKVISDWAANYKKGRDEFKKTIDENFKNVEKYLTPEDKGK